MTEQLHLFERAPYTIEADDPRAPCHDCGNPTITKNGPCEWYIVHEDIWSAAGIGYRGYLCIGCLEERLGRRLHAGDFPPDIQVNDPLLPGHSGRLRARLLVPERCARDDA